MDCCSLSLSSFPAWWMAAQSVNTLHHWGGWRGQEGQGEQWRRGRPTRRPRRSTRRQRRTRRLRKMASNMDEEQSLRECEAYVQMHGGFFSPNNFFGLIIWRNNSTSYVKYMLDLRSTSLNKCFRICYISVNLCCFPCRHPEDPEGVHCAAVCLPPWQPCQLSQGILPEARKGEYTWLLVNTVEECEWRVQFSKPKNFQ